MGTPFHPTVVLLLDDEGRRIGAYLADLLTCLPPAVRGWVEQLDVAVDEAAPGQATPGSGEPLVQQSLESELSAALGRVTNVHLRDDVRRAGYYAGDAVPVVLLVGHTTAQWLLPAAQAARAATSQAFPRTLRLAVLSDSRPADQQAAQQQDARARTQSWEALLGWTGPESAGDEPPIALCLLYQDYDERSWHWNVAQAAAGGHGVGGIGGETPVGKWEAEDVQYAVAEALFALIAAGLLDDSTFREHLRLTMPTVPGGGGEAARRFGSLATSRLAFPRAQAERACASYEGAGLLEAWLRESERFERSLGERGGRVGRSAAVRFARDLHGAIADSDEPEYLRGGVASPRLSAEGISRLYGFQATQVDPARIFATFGRREIAREVAATGAPLGTALDALDARARLRFARWREAAAEVWEADAAQRRAAMAAQVDAELAEGPAGLARARAYLRELRQALVLLRERQEDDERLRAASFQQDLREMEDEAYDRLALTPAAGRAPATTARVSQVRDAAGNAGPRTGTEDWRPEEERIQAHASGLPHPSTRLPSEIVVCSPWAATAHPGEAGPQTDPGGQMNPQTDGSQPVAARLEGTEVPERMRRLADALGKHLSARRDSLPAGATLVAAVIMILPFLGYAAVALGTAVPLHLPVLRVGAGLVPLNAVATGLALALMIALPPAVIYQRRIEEARTIRRLLVRVHVRWWAEVCGHEEDGLRHKTLGVLAAAIEERLAAVTAFEERLRAATEQLRAAGDGVERELERGPAGRRDVFVIGGRRFPAVRLADFYQAMRQRRASHPVDAAHADDETLGAAFRRHLQASERPLLAYTTDELAAQAAAFGAEACRPYISGELVVVTSALYMGALDDDPERVALGTLLERATPLFRPLSTESPRRVTALAAPADVLLVDGVEQASGLIDISTPSPEWLLVAHLVSQARPRWWRRSLPQRATTDVQAVQQPAASMVPAEE